jgi:hypothetical protein
LGYGLDSAAKICLHFIMIPTWKKDLDALVSETMAFAASVKGQQSAQPQPVDSAATDGMASTTDKITDADPPILAAVEAVLAEEPTAPSRLPDAPSPIPEPKTMPARLRPMMLPPASERDEIKQRLENFKAHQQKMQAEREVYYLQTMTRTRAVAAGAVPAKDE